jgi:hypothetical protein
VPGFIGGMKIDEAARMALWPTIYLALGHRYLERVKVGTICT